MKASPIPCFLLISSLVLVSCSASRPAVRDTNLPEGVFGKMDSTLLFRARIHVLRQSYSGIVLLKKLESDQSIHIVFMTELGPSLMELKYTNDEFHVLKIMEFINRKSIVRTIENDFRSLLLDLHEIQRYSISQSGHKGKVLKFRHRSQKYAYYYEEGFPVKRITRRPGIFHRVIVCIDRKEQMVISINHRGIRLRLDLKQISI